MSLESTCEAPKSLVDGDNRFAGKTIIITGAGGEFGRGGCVYFVRRGARIAALDRSEEGLKATLDTLVSEFGQENIDFNAYICDVTNAAQIQQVMESVVERFNSVDLLWNNAGYQGKIQPLLEYDPDDFKTVMDINVTGESGKDNILTNCSGSHSQHHFSFQRHVYRHASGCQGHGPPKIK